MNWLDHVEKWKDCTRCPLHRQRYRIALARGTVPCDVLFVGEAPGAGEDALGLPFVGPAGRLLDQIIERAIPPEVTYALTNLVACFPHEAKSCGDNEPEREEVLACRSRLIEFADIAQPRLTVCVGALSTAYIPTGEERRVSIDHPAYILRMPLARKSMATQKAIVVVRTAVMDAVECSERKVFTGWTDASTKPSQRSRFLDADIPF